MDHYGVVGNPIQHSLSPKLHQAFAEQTRQHLTYDKYLVALDQFESAIQNFKHQGFKGLNITVPFKERAVLVCDRLSERAKIAGAVNTILFKEDGSIFGDNTDGVGLVRDITINHHFNLEAKRILLVGAGGAARGVIKPIIDTKPNALTITNRTIEKAQLLAIEFSDQLNFAIQSKAFEEINEPYDCIINATSMGLTETEFPLPSSLIGKPCCCYDMVYNKKTSFLNWAKQSGASLILDGLGMLIEQAAEAFFLWRGVHPSTQDLKDFL